MTDTCAHSKDFITVKQRTQAPPSEKMNFFPARSDMCPMVFSVLPRQDSPGSCWKIFRQNCRSCESLPLPLFSCPAHVSTPAHICPSLTDALSIFSRSKWWGSEILMYPLSIMSLIVELHMFIVERERKCDPRVRYSSPPQLRPSQNTSDVICERRTYMGRCRNVNGQESSRRQGKGCYKFVILAY